MKVLWSVDAFDDLPTLQENSVQVLRRFAAKTKLQIVPVYILSPEQLGMNLEFSGQWSQVYAPSAKKALEQKLKGIDVPGLDPPHIITQNRPSLRASAETLANYARNGRFDAILIGSHGRKGVKRMFLGSFAEELLQRAKTPVLVIGGETKSVAESWSREKLRILIPNDLSNPRAPFLGEALKTADALAGDVTLLTALPSPLEQIVQSGVYLLSGGIIPTQLYLDQERETILANGRIALESIRPAHISTEHVVDTVSPSVVESIVKHARENKIGLIAMVAESGPLTTALLGSVARQVVRLGSCPVLVYRT